MRKLANEELNRLEVDEFKKVKKNPIVLVLDNVRSMNNVGSAFRTGDAFLIEKIYLCGITAQPPHREINKTALGATETVEWEHFESTLEAIEKLKKDGYKILSVEQAENSLSLEKFTPEPHEKYAYVFGNEVYGVEQEVVDQSDHCLEIPQFGTKHSLNISVSIGVVLWHTVFKSGMVR
ncbi:RNA methyltransferase [uncultured Marivirga sp.]|uniref:RNA methyltransferase n=1 Tax=uncultured Marivirga sp. TaxID=1123707 RepID=UPI0030EDBB80|tara:strand:+ start:5914 stop:6450 length:537 start_codon:yes stop_codon:yes gene_type:complete